MKKVFFAVTVCTLAIAAVSATKANSRVLATGYTQNTSTGFCTVSSGIDCNGTRIACEDNGNQLYAFNASAACSVELKKP